jgi:hypothetical protein
MAKFNRAAKLTQAKYGTNNMPATGDRRQKAIMVAAIAAHRRTMSTQAAPGLCSPKNSHDHAKRL